MANKLTVDVALRLVLDKSKMKISEDNGFSSGRQLKTSDFSMEEMLLLLLKGDLKLDVKDAVANGTVAEATVVDGSFY